MSRRNRPAARDEGEAMVLRPVVATVEAVHDMSRTYKHWEPPA